MEFVATQGIALQYADGIAPEGFPRAAKLHCCLEGHQRGPSPRWSTSVRRHSFIGQRNRGETSKRQRETEAEAVAFVVCRVVGLETGSACQDYIQLDRGDASLLMSSLESIRDVASRILVAISDSNTGNDSVG